MSHLLTIILSHEDKSSSVYTISEKQIITQLSLPQSHELHGSYEKKTKHLQMHGKGQTQFAFTLSFFTSSHCKFSKSKLRENCQKKKS